MKTFKRTFIILAILLFFAALVYIAGQVFLFLTINSFS